MTKPSNMKQIKAESPRLSQSRESRTLARRQAQWNLEPPEVKSVVLSWKEVNITCRDKSSSIKVPN